jgi:hypothetical protein
LAESVSKHNSGSFPIPKLCEWECCPNLACQLLLWRKEQRLLRNVLVVYRCVISSRMFSEAGIRRMEVIAVVTERFPAAFRSAVGANRGSTVRALSNGWLATTDRIAVPVIEFNEATRASHSPTPHKRRRNHPTKTDQDHSPALSQRVPRVLPTANSSYSGF